MSAPALIELRDVTRHYAERGVFFAGAGHGRVARALDGVDLAIAHGETLGLVGESGCGKSTLARLALMLEEPTTGSVAFEGQALAAFDARATRDFRRRVQAVFQDPTSSLSPRMRCGEIVAEPLLVHGELKRAQIAERVAAALGEVGLAPDTARRHPHTLSGGQRQRVAIARAIASEPALIVLDEPISALDVSIRAQILNLLADLKSRRDTAYLFIAHDLVAVASLADRIAVMYLGRIVETGTATAIAEAPAHPYTQMLFAASEAGESGTAPRGEPASAYAPPSGCRFHPRCPLAQARCAAEEPLLREVSGRQVACHFA